MRIVWLHAEASRRHLGEGFDRLVAILRKAEEQDVRFGWRDRLTFELR
ncbi:uncharacterized protein CMC5_077900 [Chondromyces crocatus]|uniref:Transposase n=1 Tax=Chondromyces crocatus TaxID=52 RepID=A0A0K1ESH8_CHOCO|nr:uncharacterized protein CMC5_077900 [Chondromyces crocatus]